ncbi:HHR100Cp [Eremothecium sinecaudum]|uniref:HHR100Cp n=1 Tax=Eremothecium sinecaudum TaxID=45286 RepID=A0A0X8HWR7_9SACH|nr:HHR100Cp [Eremothecium sinecaudum]AMD22869.1 HHR100Cp [Eremothecium sinecaudum]
MAIRHFKRKLEAAEISSSDSEEGEPPVPKISESLPASDDQDQNNEEGSSASNSSGEASEGSSSDYEEVVFHRPVFLKKSQKDLANATSNDTQSTTTPTTALDRAKYFNDVNERSKALNVLSATYGTNNELLQQILNLDDNDNLNEKEREQELWLERKKLRKKRLREIELQKQKELEEYEANKLLNDELEASDGIPTEKTAITSQREQNRSKGNKTRFNSDHKDYKPSKARDFKLKDSISSEDTPSNEYSII